MTKEQIAIVESENGHELSVKNLLIPPYVVDGIQEVPENERGGRVQMALSAGMPLVRHMGQNALSEALQAEREQLERFANQSVEQIQLAGESLNKALEQKSAAMQASIIHLFGSDDSPIPEQIRSKVLSAVRDMPEEYGKIFRNSMDQIQQQATTQHQTLLSKIEGLEKMLVVQEAVKKEAERGTHKGRVHEEIVNECITNLIRTTLSSDLTGRAIGTEKDLKGGTKGDYLISLAERPLVVIEAKHQNHSKKSLQTMAKLAQTYLEARGAAFCIFVYASIDEAPESRHLFLDAKNRWATCVVNPEYSESEFFLLSAIQIAILIGQQFTRAIERQVPWDQFSTHVDRLTSLINEAMDGSRSIKTFLEQSVKASTSSRDAFDSWITRVNSIVQALTQLIKAELDEAS